MCEKFIQFIPVPDVTAEGLAVSLISALSSVGIMSGVVNGVQARISDSFPSAIYVHCASHSLNLAITSICDVREIRHCMSLLGEIYLFF